MILGIMILTSPVPCTYAYNTSVKSLTIV